MPRMTVVRQVGVLLLLGLCAEARNPLQVSDAVTIDTSSVEPRRHLLATRTVSGKIWWADAPLQVISGATITAYDKDVVGRETMGSAVSKADGTYVITYLVKNWDTCCFSATNPDIVLEVKIAGKVYYRSGEFSNVASSLSGKNMAIPRFIVSGKLVWQETCVGAIGAKASIYDNDPFPDPDDFMGSTFTKADGSYLTSIPRSDNLASWDLFGGNPDPFVKFSKAGSSVVAGQTAEKTNVGGATVSLNYGTTTLWRDDASASKTIANAIGGSRKNYVSVTEYIHCNPKRIVVTIYLNIKKAIFSAPPDSLVPKLKLLIKQGIAENWSRVGFRAITVGLIKYDVHVRVLESASGYATSLKHAKTVKKACERSNNPGIPVVGLDMTMWYNEGCAKFGNATNWQAFADYEFKETAAHEWGHTVLTEAKSFLESWTHKGSTTLLQEPSASATNYPVWPATGDIDIMRYYKNGMPPGNRTWAVDLDVRRLIAIGATKRLKRCGFCPFTPPPPPPPPPA